MRLIDADKLVAVTLTDGGYWTKEVYYKADIDAAPTVYPLPNGPLTLEELREMDGEPVWVEIPEHRVKEWCIAKFDPLMGRMRLWCSGGGWFDVKNCGKSVFIYRRKPEEGV